MALQAGVSTVKVLILLGAGLTGTFVVNNGRLSDLISDLSKVISKHLKEDEVAGKVSDKTADIAVQVLKLRQELKQLSASREVTVVNGSANENGGLTSVALPAVLIGAAGYGYFRWKGWSFSDFLYVTKRHMANAVSEVSKQFEQVSAALATTRKHLSLRLEDVSKALEDSVAVQGLIKNEVLDIRGDVFKCGGDVQIVQKMVQGLELKIGEVQSKQDFANKGILLLCQYVQGLEKGHNGILESGVKLELLQATRSRLDLPASNTQVQQPSSSSSSSSSAPSVPLSSGLKELQLISQKLGTAATSDSNGTTTSSSLQRTIRPTFSLDFKRYFTFAVSSTFSNVWSWQIICSEVTTSRCIFLNNEKLDLEEFEPGIVRLEPARFL